MLWTITNKAQNNCLFLCVLLEKIYKKIDYSMVDDD